jgi:hypothetical protein
MKYWVLAALCAALAIPAAAIAADLHDPHTGGAFSCPAGDIGTYHFVNNKTGGAAAGTLDAQFSTGDVSDVAPYMVLQNVQHFSVTHTGALLDAQTTLPGMLVLSDFSCRKKDPDPK